MFSSGAGISRAESRQVAPKSTQRTAAGLALALSVKAQLAGLCLSAAVVLLLTAGYGQALPIADDTHINLRNGEQNDGSRRTAGVGDAASDGIRRGFVRFDLSSLDRAVCISEAIPRLLVGSLEDSRSVDLCVITGEWTEGILTASSTPPIGACFATVRIRHAENNKYVGVDTTSLMRDSVDQVLPNQSIAILPGATDDIRWEVAGKENGGDTPWLELESTPVRPEVPPGAIGRVGLQDSEITVNEQAQLAAPGLPTAQPEPELESAARRNVRLELRDDSGLQLPGPVGPGRREARTRDLLTLSAGTAAVPMEKIPQAVAGIVAVRRGRNAQGTRARMSSGAGMASVCLGRRIVA